MKKSLGAVVCALVVAGIVGVGAQMQNFSVLNKTGFTITALYVSEVDNDDWENDVLGRDVLPDGEEFEIKFSGYSSKNCKFDVRIDDEDENEWIVEDIDLCKIHKLKFTKKGKKVLWEAR